MGERPELSASLDAETFRGYYYLKEELVAFCRRNHLPVSGGKTELTERIADFLDTGTVSRPRATRKTPACVGTITEQTVIEPDKVCSEAHRAFSAEKVGRGFPEMTVCGIMNGRK